MDIVCPYCGAEYEVDESTIGKKVDCVTCGKEFVAGQTIRQEEAPSAQIGAFAAKMAKTAESVMSEEGLKRSVETMGGKFREFTGTEKLEGFSFGALFSDVFKKHHEDEIESLFAIGTPSTTPSIEEVDTSWPRPWMFFRTLVGTVIAYFLFACAWDWFENVNLIPGLIFIGAMAMPFATLLFFFEMNARRNVSIFQVLRMVVFGGVVSLIISLVLFKLPLESMGWMGASVAGLIEEPGKLLALLFIARSSRYRYELNGLLLGACVGTGFAIFESMGYAFQVLLIGNSSAMNDNIIYRGLLSPFGHIVWTSICGAAMWRVKGSKPFKITMFGDGRFWHLFMVPVVLHMIWNANFSLPFFGKHIILGVIAWIVVLALVQEGLKELRKEKVLGRGVLQK